MGNIWIIFKSILLLPITIPTNLVLLVYDSILDYLTSVGLHSRPNSGGGSWRELRRWKNNVNEVEFRDRVVNKEPKNKQAEKVEPEVFSRGQVVNHLAEMNRKEKDPDLQQEPAL